MALFIRAYVQIPYLKANHMNNIAHHQLVCSWTRRPTFRSPSVDRLAGRTVGVARSRLRAAPPPQGHSLLVCINLAQDYDRMPAQTHRPADTTLVIRFFNTLFHFKTKPSPKQINAVYSSQRSNSIPYKSTPNSKHRTPNSKHHSKTIQLIS